MKRIYKILSLILSAAMVFGSFSVSAFSVDVVATISGSSTVSGDYTDLYEAYDAAINVNEAVTITMKKDVTLDSPLYESSTVPKNSKGITFDLNDCTITVEGGGYFLKNKTPLTITDNSAGKGGTIQSSEMTDNNGLIYHNIGKDMIIEAGTFIANGKYVVNASGYQAANVIIYGGVFQNTDGGTSIRANTSNIRVIAGEFYGAPGTRVTIEGEKTGDDSHWIVVKSPLAEVTVNGVTNEYYTLDDALLACVGPTTAPVGGEVYLKLLRDISISARMTLRTGTTTTDATTRTITFDANGHTITASQKNGLEIINKNTTLRLTGNGTWIIPDDGYFFTGNNGSVLIVESGTFIGARKYASDKQIVGTGSVSCSITGGKFYVDPSSHAIGSITEGTDDLGDYWLVSPIVVASVTIGTELTEYNTISGAVSKVVEAGETPAVLTILRDIKMTARSLFAEGASMSDDLTARDITLDLNGHTIDASGLNSGAFGIGKGARLTIIDSSGTNQGTLRTGGGYHIYLPSDNSVLIYKSGTFIGTTPVEDGHTGFVRRNDEGQYVGNVSAIGGLFDLDPSEGDQSIVDETVYKVEEQGGKYAVKSKFAPDVVASFNDTGYGTVGEAIAAVLNTESKSGTIIFVANVTLSGKIAVFDKDADITFDLNGHTVREEEGGTARMIEIVGGSAAFTDGTLVLSNEISYDGHISVEGGALRLTGVTIESEAESLSSSEGGAVYVGPGAELNADSKTVFVNCSSKEGAAVYVDANMQTGTVGKAYIDASFTDCASTDEASVAPVYSCGFVFVSSELATDGNVYQKTTAAKVLSAAPTLESDFRFKIVSQIALSADDAEAETGLAVNFDGKETFYPSALADGMGRYSYQIDGITANKMADDIEFTVKTSDGKALSAAKQYSVLMYCANVFESTLKNDHDNFRLLELLANIVKYGYEVQKYWGEGKAFEVPEQFVPYISTALPTATDNVKRTTVSAVDAGTYKIKGASININDRVGIFFNVFTTDPQATVKVFCGGEEIKSLIVAEQTVVEADVYRVELDRLTPLEFSEEFEIILYNAGGEQVHGVAYSVNSYCYAKQSSVNVRDISLAVYRYGLTAYAYKYDTEE